MVGVDRVKFYSAEDLASASQLMRIPAILDSDLSDLDCSDINQVIELYNISEYFDAGLALKQWDNLQIEKYKGICEKEILSIIGRFFSHISDENMLSVLERVEMGYHDEFWELFERYRLCNRISETTINYALNDGNVHIRCILKRKKIVQAYNQFLTGYLRMHPEYASLIIQEYLVKTDQGKLYFPSELTPADKVKMVEEYIDLPDASPGLVGLIENAQSSSDLPVDDHLKLKARRAYQKWRKEHLNQQVGIGFDISVRFRDTEEDVNYSFKDASIEFVYGTKWIEENMDCPTLMNNLIYLFWLVDHWFRCVLVSLPNQLSVLERFIGVKGKKEYLTGSTFHCLDVISSTQIMGYQSVLINQGIRLETLFKWFFETYLLNEFGVSGFSYDAPSEASSLLEKCMALARAMDSSLKQFRMYCRDATIDRELFEISSGHVLFNSIPSMQSCKYVYAKSQDIKNEMYNCYSDQSMLTYNRKTKGEYENLPRMVSSIELMPEDFEDYQKPRIEYLVQRGLLIQQNSGCLEINGARAFILRELFSNEVICCSYCTDEIKGMIDQLVQSGDLEVENTLFSKPEQDYYNYMLNRSCFCNGLDLRNRYIHGTNSNDEKEMERDYVELLKLSAIMVIKINEEFCLKFPSAK